jgi:hypothetical protein
MKKASFPCIICSPKQKERRHQKGAEKYTSKTEKTPEHHSQERIPRKESHTVRRCGIEYYVVVPQQPWVQRLILLAYNLMNWFKETALGNQKEKEMTGTIRWKIIWIPAKLVKRGRSFKLKLADWWTYQRQFQRAQIALI